MRGPGHEDRADEVQLVEADQEQQHQRHLGGVVQEEALRVHLPGEGGGQHRTDNQNEVGLVSLMGPVQNSKLKTK